jgi:hypothetical protein
MPALKKGKYVCLPEGPEDMDRLWEEAEVLTPDNLPDWLTAEDAGDYRHVGSLSRAGLEAGELKRYEAELEELEEAGLIVDRDPGDCRISHVFMAAPAAHEVWSIGIYTGKSPLTLASPPQINNPVLTRADVLDVPALFVADPFMIRVQDTWHMFFEVMNWRSRKGEIGLAVSKDGFQWTYNQIVLTEPFHLSYPSVFAWEDSYYLIPESYQAGGVRLYRAEEFPTQWSFVTTLLEGPYLAEPSVFRLHERWWMFAETSQGMKQDTLCLYSADDLRGPWRPHPQNPVVEGNPAIARPAGRVLTAADGVFRFAQNCESEYGTEVRTLAITELTATTYREREVSPHPLLGASGAGWNASGMHHVDPHLIGKEQWLACVDGWFRKSGPPSWTSPQVP